MSDFLVGMAAALLVVCAFWFWHKARSKKPEKEIRIFSGIETLRAIGQLSVYKVMTKEIVTQTDHTWGDFGTRYLSWVLSGKKMAMIFEFEIDFRYNLQSPQFEINEVGLATYRIEMPPCDYEVHIRDIRFYDEQGSKLLPWLLPDLLNGFIVGGFSEEDKNKLVNAAKEHARQQALTLINNIQSDVQLSAKSTLESLSRAFGATEIEFTFAARPATDVTVAFSEKIAS